MEQDTFSGQRHRGILNFRGGLKRWTKKFQDARLKRRSQRAKLHGNFQFYIKCTGGIKRFKTLAGKTSP